MHISVILSPENLVYPGIQKWSASTISIDARSIPQKSTKKLN